MANLALRLPENVPGDFFVDSTCIDCDACRQIAPETFTDDRDASIVHHQPATEDAIRRALMAKLLDNYLQWDFEWVLPGHGRIHHDSPKNMRAHLERCIEWMKTR